MKGFHRWFTLTGEGLAPSPLRGTVSHRSSEENESGDFSRAVETVLFVVHDAYAPAGGFVRGMTLTPEAGGGVYRILTPVQVGHLWRLKAERIHTEG